jgi:hypothetical protein
LEKRAKSNRHAFFSHTRMQDNPHWPLARSRKLHSKTRSDSTSARRLSARRCERSSGPHRPVQPDRAYVRICNPSPAAGILGGPDVAQARERKTDLVLVEARIYHITLTSPSVNDMDGPTGCMQNSHANGVNGANGLAFGCQGTRFLSSFTCNAMLLPRSGNTTCLTF